MSVQVSVASDIRLFGDVRSSGHMSGRHEALNFGGGTSPRYVVMTGISEDMVSTALEPDDVVSGALSLDGVFSGSYSWDVSIWGYCPGTCGMESTSVRIVGCVSDSDGSSVDDSFCTSPRPASSRSCISTEACTYAWSDWSVWSGCEGGTDGSCGTGTKTRSRSCMRSDGTPADDSFCAGSPTDMDVCGACLVCSDGIQLAWVFMTPTKCYVYIGGDSYFTSDNSCAPMTIGGVVYTYGAYSRSFDVFGTMFEGHQLCHTP